MPKSAPLPRMRTTLWLVPMLALLAGCTAYDSPTAPKTQSWAEARAMHGEAAANDYVMLRSAAVGGQEPATLTQEKRSVYNQTPGSLRDLVRWLDELRNTDPETWVGPLVSENTVVDSFGETTVEIVGSQQAPADPSCLDSLPKLLREAREQWDYFETWQAAIWAAAAAGGCLIPELSYLRSLPMEPRDFVQAFLPELHDGYTRRAFIVPVVTNADHDAQILRILWSIPDLAWTISTRLLPFSYVSLAVGANAARPHPQYAYRQVTPLAHLRERVRLQLPHAVAQARFFESAYGELSAMRRDGKWTAAFLEWHYTHDILAVTKALAPCQRGVADQDLGLLRRLRMLPGRTLEPRTFVPYTLDEGIIQAVCDGSATAQDPECALIAIRPDTLEERRLVVQVQGPDGHPKLGRACLDTTQHPLWRLPTSDFYSQ